MVESLCKHIADPPIIVVDDGQPERRFLPAYPETAAKCQVIHPANVDVGVGVARNIAVDAVSTEFMFLLDDDHVVTPNLNLDKLIDRFSKLDIDLLGVRQGAGGRPTMLSPLMNGKRIWMHRGEIKRNGYVAWCHMSSNAFLARAETIRQLRWDEELKTFEHWEFFYRAKLAELKVAVAGNCFVKHAHVESADYRVCLQKTCTQLHRGMLWKCPALAYFAQLESKLKLHDLPQWQLFRDYQACPAAASDDEVRQFIQTKSIPQCGLCPSRRTKFVHPNPLQRSALR